MTHAQIRRTIAFSAVCFAVILCPAMGLCNDSPTDNAPADEPTLHFQQGIEFYKQQRYEAASIEFGRAYELRPSYKILYNIGQAENMLEHFAAALKAYQTYLDQGGNDIPKDRHELVAKEIARLLTRVGYVEIRGGAAGAAVLIDGEQLGVLPLVAPITVDIGRREVEITSDTSRLFRQIYPVAGGQHIVVDLEASKKPVQASSTEDAKSSEAKSDLNSQGEDRAPDGRNAKKISGALLLGLGLSAGIGGAVTGGIATSKRKSVTKACDGHNCDADTYTDDFDAVKHLSISTDVLLGAAAVAFTTGLILLLVKPKPEKTATIAASVTPTQGGALAAVSGSF